eukprot:CAMPEP_0194520646 /NCGR_PEP_ID=MMETSP0253-20130528/54720_1 /TAXON_ID=2966 /ORGANISM="Noctiluca scintillans" /LENGTH=167 /DNA_ID=CAMNT_0039364915 /DNA_START=711 /DNA_END=1212 /DNA_ORIENTATION=-
MVLVIVLLLLTSSRISPRVLSRITTRGWHLTVSLVAGSSSSRERVRTTATHVGHVSVPTLVAVVVIIIVVVVVVHGGLQQLVRLIDELKRAVLLSGSSRRTAALSGWCSRASFLNRRFSSEALGDDILLNPITRNASERALNRSADLPRLPRELRDPEDGRRAPEPC